MWYLVSSTLFTSTTWLQNLTTYAAASKKMNDHDSTNICTSFNFNDKNFRVYLILSNQSWNIFSSGLYFDNMHCWMYLKWYVSEGLLNDGIYDECFKVISGIFTFCIDCTRLIDYDSMCSFLFRCLFDMVGNV